MTQRFKDLIGWLNSIRFRDYYMFLGTFLVILLFVLEDPAMKFIQDMPFGAGTIVMLTGLLKSILFGGILHLSRRGLFDYIDFSALISKAAQTPEGAGSAAIAVAIAMIAIAIVITAAVISN